MRAYNFPVGWGIINFGDMEISPLDIPQEQLEILLLSIIVLLKAVQ